MWREDLDNFITKESADYTKSLLSVTYIVTNKSKNKVVAYFSLAADKLSVNDFASNSEFNRFRKRRFVHEKRLRSYPAVKLCRLGVDISMKGTGLGSIILSLIEFLCTQGKSHRLPFYYCRCLQNCHPILYKKWLSTALKRNIELFYRTIIHGFTFDVIKLSLAIVYTRQKQKFQARERKYFAFLLLVSFILCTFAINMSILSRWYFDKTKTNNENNDMSIKKFTPPKPKIQRWMTLLP